MLTWVMYDIVKDSVRNKVAKSCEQAGIYRVQYSVFLGELNPGQRKELRSILEDLIDKDVDSIYLFPMCKDDFKQCILLGQAFDKELITDEVRTLIL